MKKILFIASLLLLVSSFNVNAQKKCKCDFDKVDPISNERVRREMFTINMFYKANFYRKGDDLRFEFYIAMNGEQNFIISKGTKATFKLPNDEIIEIEAAADAAPKSYVQGTLIKTSYAVTYNISKAQMQKIADNGMKFIRIDLYGDQNATFEVSSGKSKKMQKGAACILVD